MNQRNSFFSTANAKQIVNQWLCIALISLMCFWVVLFYVTNSVQAVGSTYTEQLKAALSQ